MSRSPWRVCDLGYCSTEAFRPAWPSFDDVVPYTSRWLWMMRWWSSRKLG